MDYVAIMGIFVGIIAENVAIMTENVAINAYFVVILIFQMKFREKRRPSNR